MNTVLQLLGSCDIPWLLGSCDVQWLWILSEQNLNSLAPYTKPLVIQLLHILIPCSSLTPPPSWGLLPFRLLPVFFEDYTSFPSGLALPASTLLSRAMPSDNPFPQRSLVYLPPLCALELSADASWRTLTCSWIRVCHNFPSAAPLSVKTKARPLIPVSLGRTVSLAPDSLWKIWTKRRWHLAPHLMTTGS